MLSEERDIVRKPQMPKELENRYRKISLLCVGVAWAMFGEFDRGKHVL